MQEQINSIESKIDKIHEALCGNEYNDNGLINRVKSVEDYQKKDQKQKWVAVGVALAFTTITKYWDKLTHLF